MRTLKLFEARTILLTLPAQAGYEILNLALALSRGELGQYAAALADLSRRLPAIWAGRRRFQKARRVSDRLLLGAPALSWSPEVRALPMARTLKRVLDTVGALWWKRIACGAWTMLESRNSESPRTPSGA